MNDIENQVYTALKNLKNLDRLTELFCSDLFLNYEYSGNVVSQRGWKEQVTDSIHTLQLIGTHDDFHIVFCEVGGLLLGTERPIINQLLKNHPYCLVVFADPSYQNWHFVNIKYDEEAKNRRLFRRIVIGPDERLHTAAQRISLLDVSDESMTALDLQRKHDEAFDVEKVTSRFHSDYRTLFNEAINKIRGRESYDDAHKFTHLLFNRLMFLYFVQRKGWLKAITGEEFDRDFIHSLWKYYKAKGSKQPHTFYRDWLKPLFFDAMKNPRKHGFKYSQHISPELLKVFLDDMPYLNGGLFQEDDEVDGIDFRVEDDIFEDLIGKNGLLQRYNFTVREDLPLDIEVALDHDMLGTVYESVVNEEERGEAGMFYTPRTEVDFMCRSSVIQYLAGFRILPQEDLIRFVMNADYPDEVPDIERDALSRVRDRIREVKVVDPACGSGAFLVGMLKVLSGILRTIHGKLGQPLDMFDERRRMIGENLYGVDIKSWAVKICELRLWLTLVVEADEGKLDLKNKPLLPNLDYNIVQGDSLVEEIVPGRQLVLRSEYSDIRLSPRIKRQISEIQKLKSAYYASEPGINRLEIESKKQTFLRGFFIEEQKRLQGEMVRLRRGPEPKAEQSVMDFARRSEQARLELRESEEERAQREKKIAELEKQFHDYQRMTGELSLIGTKGYFLWDLDFAEVFYQRGGFDVVIGNPPYVRQEGIAPPTRYEEDYDADTWREMKREYKEKLIESVNLHWQGLKKDRKCDLYIYFYLHGLALLRPGGTFCFITSNSWLDVGYGVVLQKFLLENIEVDAIFDNQAKRSFASADVNTVISLFRRPGSRKDWLKTRENHLARFVTFNKPFEACLTADNLAKIFAAPEVVKEEEDFRVYPISHGDLFQEGAVQEEKPPAGTGRQATMIRESMDGKYAGGKWGGKYLRAPDIFFTILEKGKGKLVRLGDIAEVRFGIKTGADNWFYVGKQRARELSIEQEFLHPLLVSSSQVKTYTTRGSDTDQLLVTTSKSKRELRDTCFLSYILEGETKPFPGRGGPSIPAKRPSCKNHRPYWYSIKLPEIPAIYWMEMRRERYFTLLNRAKLNADHTFYAVYPSSEVAPICLCGLLNSTLIPLFVELFANDPGGGGTSLQTPIGEIKRHVLLPRSLLRSREGSKAFQEMCDREVVSILKEIGMKDRRALDDIIFDVLGLTQGERDAVYDAVVDLVQTRLEKARSV